MARAKPRGGVAPLHADEGARDAAARAHRARRRRMAVRLRRQALPGRRQFVVGEPLRPRQPAHQRRAGGAAVRTRPRDAGRLHAPPGGRIVGTLERTGARRAGPRVLRLRRRVGHRDRAEDELPLLAQRRPAGQARLRQPAGGYHGETLGALAVTDVALFRDTYAPLLNRNAVVPCPDPRRGESRATPPPPRSTRTWRNTTPRLPR